MSIFATLFIFALPISDASAIEKDNIQQGKTIEKELPKIYTGNQFIDSISEASMKLGADYGIYASVMIAQSILESNYGKSILSKSPNNNLFGIKGTYKGKGSTFKTAESTSSGNLFKTKSNFRQYPTVEQSLEDYANLIKYGLKFSSSYYNGAWKVNTNNYKDATAYLQKRYASDKKYAGKLNHLIEKYDLTRFDVDSYARYEADQVITIVSGDTLRKLAEKYKTTVNDLKQWNQLDSNQINVGQKIIVTIKDIKAIPTKQTTFKGETEINTQISDDSPVEKVKKKKEIVYKPTKYYTVIQGDSITSIATINHISIEELKKWNKLKDASLTAGKNLIVDIEGSKKKETKKVKKQGRYLIKAGDSLASIATKFNVTEQKIIQLNRLDSVFVYEGQIIKLTE